jgi:sigma-B regulation protein RsbU (phosphoserine phosphatase)
MSHSLTARLIVWTLALAGVVYTATIGLSNYAGRRAAIAAAEREATNATEAAARRVEDVLHAAEESVRALARSASVLGLDQPALDRLVRQFSADNRTWTGRYTAFLVPGPATPPAWYNVVVPWNDAGWTEPFKDPDENATVVTFAVPFTGGIDRPGGVAAASLRLDFLSAIVRDVRLGQGGFALVVSRRGLLIAHSRRDLSEGVHDPLAELSPSLRAILEPVMKRAEAGESGFAAVPVGGRAFRLTFRPVGQAGWSLATAYAEDELLADVTALWQTQAFMAVTGLAVLASAVVLLSRRITRPIVALSAGAARLATGDLDGPLPEPASNDEIGALTRAFQHMRGSLKEYIRNLQETTAAKERLEGELKTARRIQADMLPPPTAGGAAAGYHLAAVLEPARAVGGDLFDHFEHDGRVFFLVADVSGKGVAAALFMARAKTLFDAIPEREEDPGAILGALNRALCHQNEAGMYVTAVCGVLDGQSRQVHFATAGHEPPVLVKAAGPPAPLATEGGRVLGLIEFGDYPVSSVTLAKGDALVMYTDGVSEAQDPDGEFFGPERLLAAVTRDAAGDAAALTRGLLADVKAFASTAPQSDDITILTIKVP